MTHFFLIHTCIHTVCSFLIQKVHTSLCCIQEETHPAHKHIPHHLYTFGLVGTLVDTYLICYSCHMLDMWQLHFCRGTFLFGDGNMLYLSYILHVLCNPYPKAGVHLKPSLILLESALKLYLGTENTHVLCH